ncbi:MAG: PDZ domain-containing protein [Vicinamibacterales bacterium]
MTPARWFLGAVLLLVAMPVAGQSMGPSSAGPSSAGQSSVGRDGRSGVVVPAPVDRAIAAVYPSLVRISVVSLQWAGGREVRREASGSGTIVSPDGYIVTNHHVAGRVDRIVCTLPSNEEVPARLVGTDPLSDIAVLQLTPDTPRTFPAARWGTSATLRRGEPVLAMGSPLSLSQSVTQGIVSNTDMVMPQMFGDALGALDGEDVGTIVKWIGHDAAIYPGNSGGPLVSLAGEIVGVNEISFGLSGAIPADLAREVYEAIRRDGRVRRSWTGLTVQPRLEGMAGPGALVAWVEDGSPAAAAGFVAGDVLVRVGDAAVDARFVEQLPAINQTLFGLRIGAPVRVVVRRDGREVAGDVTPVERPDAATRPVELRNWGIVGANLSAFEAREMARESADGVRVVNLRPGGPSDQARPSLGRDDVIVAVDDQPVRSVEDLRRITGAALADKARASLLVGFDRGPEHRLTVVDVGLPTTSDAAPEARKAWVPVAVQVLTPPLAERLGLKGKTGVRVTRILRPDVPLQVGDIVLAIDGEPVRASAPADEDVFAAAIRRYRIGNTVSLTVHRGAAETEVPVLLAESPRLSREMARYDDDMFDFRARDIAPTDTEDPRLADVVRGAMIDSVTPGGWAALARLEVGDVVLAVSGTAIADVAGLEARMAEIDRARPASVVFLVRRGIRTVFLQVRPSWR